MKLREAHRFSNTGSSVPPVAVNDLVMLHEESQPRGFWRLAKIKNLMMSGPEEPQ